jgi:methylated-DNA-[protein]-cysteine S-methyltransferase
MSEMERFLEAAAKRLPGEGLERPAGLVERAGRSGLLDVAYTEVGSPFGSLLVAATPRGLLRVSFESESFDVVLEELARRVSPRVLQAPARLDEVRKELDEYFEGRRHRFGVPLDWALSIGFRKRVLQATARIPYGSVATYTQMAAKAGNPRAARAAGNALHHNPIPIVVPCHRVVRGGGALGGYGGGIDMKRSLLDLEGAPIPCT